MATDDALSGASSALSVLVIAKARILPALRGVLEQLDLGLQRTTEVARAQAPLSAQIARARAVVPSRGVVVIVDTEDHVDGALALGADEVVAEPDVTPACLTEAISRAALRASVREDQAGQARTLEQVMCGLAELLDSPLTALALDLDALRSDEETRTGDELSTLDDCVGAVERMSALLRDLHLLLPHGDGSLSEPLVLPVLVDQILGVLSGALGHRALIERDDDEGLPLVHAPRRPLARALAHVLVQTLDAVSDPARRDEGLPPSARGTGERDVQRLRVSVRRHGGGAAIVVDARPRLESPPASAPTLLGTHGRLSGAREILRTSGGELLIERSSDGGLRAMMILPPPEPQQTNLSPRTAAASVTTRGRRPHVLIVDADERVLRATARAVAEHYDTIVATSGEEALARAAAGGLDAIVVDQRLPDVSLALFVDELLGRCPSLVGRIVFIVRAADELPPGLGSSIVDRPIRRSALLAALRTVLSHPTPAAIRPLRELN